MVYTISGSQLLFPQMSPVIRKLIWTNGIVFMLTLIPGIKDSMGYFILNPELVLNHGYLWQLGTYMFLHASFSHVFWNMIMLYMLGTDVERSFGSKKFLQYYLFCGLGAAIISCFFYQSILGASGAVYGVTLGFILLFPRRTLLVFGIFPLPAWVLGVIFVLADLSNGLQGGTNIAHFAHLGGMATGALLFVLGGRIKIHMPKSIENFLSNLRRPSKPRNSSEDSISEEELNNILDKIAEKGIGALSRRERDLLKRTSSRMKSMKDSEN